MSSSASHSRQPSPKSTLIGSTSSSPSPSNSSSPFASQDNSPKSSVHYRSTSHSIPSGSRSRSNSSSSAASNSQPTGRVKMIPLRTRKRDAFRMRVYRAMHAIKQADGIAKVGLFLSLVFFTWIVFFAFPHLIRFASDDKSINNTVSINTNSNANNHLPPHLHYQHLSSSTAAAAAAAASTSATASTAARSAAAASTGAAAPASSNTATPTPTSPPTTHSPPPTAPPKRPPVVETIQVLRTYEHDPSAFTQGFFLQDGLLYESTGLYGQSSLRVSEFDGNEKQAVLKKKVSLPQQHFGEGMTILDEIIYVLTWQDRIVHTYDLSFNPLGQLPLHTDGWGLTHMPSSMAGLSTAQQAKDKQVLVLSDGTEKLYFMQPKTLKVLREVKVFTWTKHGQKKPLVYLNELEYIDGYIYANVWMSTNIAIIDPKSGAVLKMVDVSPVANVHATPHNRDAVANGIAFDERTRKLYITGKLWDKMYEVKHITV